MKAIARAIQFVGLALSIPGLLLLEFGDDLEAWLKR